MANGTRKIHYISGGDGLAAVFIMDNANPAGKMYYTYADHLGSIVAITDDTGGLLEEYSYGPWGRRRNAETWEPIINSQLSIINGRGYTGHEHLNEFGIINMNGRLYDPVLGRMLSPDNFVQAPGFTQNYNRYSYVLNNPLRYVDPDGEFIFTAFLIGMAVSAVIDYGIQVGMNYAAGYKGKDAWVNKVDFFDVAVSGAIGGFTAGWGASLKAGESIGKVGLFMVKNTKYVKAGEVLLTSGVDITGEGWQPVSFNDFGKRVVIASATWAGSKFLSNTFKKSPLTLEQQVDQAIKEAKNGVYDLDTDGGQYIGQSVNTLKRSKSHFYKNGKLNGLGLQKDIFHSMPGSTKLEREVYEQYIINSMDIENLINAVNPMGGRMDTYYKMIDNVINKYNLPYY